ncbi:MAG: SDR family oxidoreductase [Candidatus Nanohaloarchaea archaeon]|nr:SDR family oxidoreductase [Candidatus Nanohaloarchaea archaeon]
MTRDLVLGATGDIGQELLDRLDDPLGIGRSQPDTEEAAMLRADATEQLPVDLSAFDTVYHAATLNSYGHPADAVDSPDVEGTRQLVEDLQDVEPDERPGLVYVSSAAAVESEPGFDGAIDYAEAKAAGEQLADRYEDASIVRLGTVYGDGKGTISYFFSCAESGDDLNIYGDGEQLRSFVHLDDAVDAITDAPSYGDLEVAEGTYSLNQVADSFEAAADIGRQYDRDQPTEDVTLSGDWQQYDTERTLDDYISDKLQD